MTSQGTTRIGNILAVDDDPVSRIMIKSALESQGYRVNVAESGEEALGIIDREPPQIIVSDWDMPGMSGVDLCRVVRAKGVSQYIYFILLTSHSEQDRILDGLGAGADEFLTKPFNPVELGLRVGTGMRVVSLDTRDMAIFAMAKLAESRDPETGAHLERVRSYSCALASYLREHDDSDGEITDEFMKLLYLTTPLHDIGKVAIPDHVLLKPGKLTAEEFDIMKTHTLAGAETLGAALEKYPSQPFLRMAHDIALSHHEKWDGSGYPNGISGEAIPLAARILAVADVYDALVSKRAYKDAMDHAVAAKIIREGSGSHFDPRLVNAFNGCEHEFESIRRRFADPDEVREAA